MTKSEIRDKQICLLSIITGLPLSGLPNYNSVFGRLCRKTVPRKGRHGGLVPRNDVLTNGFIRFSLAWTLARILFVPRLRPSPQKPRRRCGPEEGYLRCSIIFSLFEFKSVDDVGAGKLREMLMLHTNPHAVHGRFTLKDYCERQVWDSGAVS